MGCNCSKTDASAEVVPKVVPVPVVPALAADAPVQNAPMQTLAIIQTRVPEVAKAVVHPIQAEKSADLAKDTHSALSADKISASKKKRMKQRKIKGAGSPEVIPSTVHDSHIAEALVNQSADQAYFSADSELPKKSDAGQIRKGAKKSQKPAAPRT